MSEYRLLLKREISEFFFFRRRFSKKIDFMGLFLNIFLTLGITAVIVFVYREFVNVYTEVKIDGIIDKASRIKEILTLTYGLIIVTGVFVGIRKINKDILEGKDFNILVRLPLKPQSIFLAKLTALFINQVLITSLTLIPLTVTLGITVPQTFSFWFRSMIMCLILPVISLLIASVFSIFVHYLIRFLRSRFIITTVIFTLLLGGAFLLYQEFLLILREMIEGGELKFFYNEKTMNLLMGLAKYFFPANIGATFVIGSSPLLNFLILMAVSGFSLGISSLIVIKMLNKVMTSGSDGSRQNSFRRVSKINDNSTLISLIKKEFIMVIRTPSYAFQYFATILTMPLMVYSSLTIFSEFIRVIIDVDSNFELTIFIIMMFSVLTNTFCATNISREGQMFNLIKTLPLSYKEFVFSKIIFTSLTSLISILVSCFIAYLVGFIGLGEMFLILLITSFISLSEIFYATRKDLNNPVFPDNEKNEITEATPTISNMIFLGLLMTTLIGGSLLLVNFLIKLNIERFVFLNGFVIKGSIILFSFLVFLISGFYLLIGLSKKFYETVN